MEAGAFIFLLLAADLLFILMHCFHYYTPFLNPEIFSINKDRSYAEVFMYVKEFWVIGMLLFLGFRSREWIFLMWAGLFGYIIVDDTFQVHETAGILISRSLDFTSLPYLRPKDFGELLVTGFIGIAFLLSVGLAAKAGSMLSRKVTFDLSMLLMFLVAFGVGVDMLHVIIGSFAEDGLLIILEDGGEMVAISFFCWYLFSCISRIGGKRLFISPLTGIYHTLIKCFYLPQTFKQYLK